MGEGWYGIGYCISWAIIFLGAWIYCVATYGFLLGVGLGWLPAAIVASIGALFWPLIVLAALWLVWMVLK